MDSVKKSNIEQIRKNFLNGITITPDELTAAMANRCGVSKLNDGSAEDIVGLYDEWRETGFSTEWARHNCTGLEIAAIADAHG